jgi:Fe-S cluster assembly scaffold protein SufB
MSTYGLQVTSEYIVAEYSPVVIVVPENEIKTIDRASIPGLLAIRVMAGATLNYSERVEAAGLFHTYVYIEGEGAKVNLSSRLQTDSGTLDISHKVFHLYSNSVSNIQTRGVLGGDTKLIYTSEIRAEAGTTDIVGTEKAEFVAMDSATVSGIPSLSIQTDSITCSHAFSVTPLPEKSISYLLGKGYTELQAREILTESFLTV